ncbi:MAG: CoA-binding protein, partial [Clostridia bacterium]|nr:CoA-binding protein [Clostridia bacterium]
MELELLKKKVWAVAGANQNPDKYGNMIYKRLKEKGYE